MTMYIDATRMTFGPSKNEATRSRLLINRDHIVTIEEIAGGIHITTVNGSELKSKRSTSDE